MVKNRIKIYARLKRETKQCEAFQYAVIKKGGNDVLTIYNKSPPKTAQVKFRFDKVFGTASKQDDIFDSIAKPIINGVLNGFNGTIFAYGPTGSGKTYSLTGSHTKYNNRGLIPRSIEYIFNFITNSFDSYVINISYLEIYNEIAYDLLNSKEHVSSLEELPRVLILEDNKGEAHYKNLSVPRVCSEEEAMRLLFLGDTNRTIAETPLNEYSSRSHCIFTVHVTARVQNTGKIIKSKLNLVDLAGSERMHKMNLNGITLCEAKYINLSLHYLEQVILAISETKRNHIPFRNSMMTFVLRDSISGNCLTAMLATLAINKINIEETIATCKFSQRVSLVKTDVKINEEIDPQAEIALLRSEISRLQILLTGKESENETLDKSEEAECSNSIKKYLYNNQEDDLALSDSRKVKYYINFLKKEVKKSSITEKVERTDSLTEIEQKYKKIIKQKDEEISILMNIFNNKLQEDKLKTASNHKLSEIAEIENAAFEKFFAQSEYKNTMDFYSNTLNGKHSMATEIAKRIGDEQKKITEIRARIEENRGNFEILEQLSFQLKSEQNVYRELLLKLQNAKSEIEYLRNGARQFETKVIEDFRKWSVLNNGGDLVRKCRSQDLKATSGFSAFAGDKSEPTKLAVGENNAELNKLLFGGTKSELQTFGRTNNDTNELETLLAEENKSEMQKLFCKENKSELKKLLAKENKNELHSIFFGGNKAESETLFFDVSPRQFGVRKCKSEKFDIRAKLDELLDPRIDNKTSEPQQNLCPERDTNTKVAFAVHETLHFLKNPTGDEIFKGNKNVIEDKNHDLKTGKLINSNDQNEIQLNNLMGVQKNTKNLLLNNNQVCKNKELTEKYFDCVEIQSNKLDLSNQASSINQVDPRGHFQIASNLNVDEIKNYAVENPHEARIPSSENDTVSNVSNSASFSETSSVDDRNFEEPVRENCVLFKPDDSGEFLDFMKTIPLTGDKDVDEEIVKFYRMKFKN